MSNKKIDLIVLQDLVQNVHFKSNYSDKSYAIPVIEYALQEALETKLNLTGLLESNLVKVIHDVNEGKLQSKYHGMFGVMQGAKNVLHKVLSDKVQETNELVKTGKFVASA
jgi:hypothetical protein